MHSPIYEENRQLSKLFIDENGQLHIDSWFIIEGVGGIEIDVVVFNIYFLTYCP